MTQVDASPFCDCHDIWGQRGLERPQWEVGWAGMPELGTAGPEDGAALTGHLTAGAVYPASSWQEETDKLHSIKCK